jgi:hypothetical protein
MRLITINLSRKKRMEGRTWVELVASKNVNDDLSIVRRKKKTTLAHSSLLIASPSPALSQHCHRKRWTPKEEEVLLDMYTAGLHIDQVAATLHRTSKACCLRKDMINDRERFRKKSDS